MFALIFHKYIYNLYTLKLSKLTTHFNLPLISLSCCERCGEAL